jgi:hypothetical protein
MPLAVIETNRLDPRISVERQGKTCRRILAAGKKYERPCRGFGHRAVPMPIAGLGNAALARNLAMRMRNPAKILPPEVLTPEVLAPANERRLRGSNVP